MIIKKIFVTTILFLLITFPFTGSSFAENPYFEGDINTGVSMPMGNTSEVYETGYGLNTSAILRFNKYFAAGVILVYHQYQMGGDDIDYVEDLNFKYEDGTLTMMEAIPNIKLILPINDKAEVYIQAGGGFFSINEKFTLIYEPLNIEKNVDETYSTTGYMIGVGGNFFQHLNVGIQYKYIALGEDDFDEDSSLYWKFKDGIQEDKDNSIQMITLLIGYKF